MTEKKPYHQQMAEKIIAALEAGTAPWIKPWQAGDIPQKPTNAVTNKPYRGWNSVYLSMIHPEHEDQRWCTYNQAQELGAQVRKGEQGKVIQYWKFQEKKLLTDPQTKQALLDDKGQKQYQLIKLERPKVFHAVVFHASQIDDMPPLPEVRELPEWARHEQAEQYLQASQAKFFHDQNDRAYYHPKTDEIHLPAKGLFETADAYYATALHELGHWTGHSSRLNRDLEHPFGSEGYAKEELRAEISSYMLGQELGIGHDPSQHVAYIEHWVKILKQDPAEIFRAASDAQNAIDLIAELAQRHEITLDEEPIMASNQSASINPQSEEVPASQSQATAIIATEKTWLNVPYEDKEEAKKLGAKWDRTQKSWYAPQGTDLSPLGPWKIAANTPRQPPALAPIDEFAEALQADGLIIQGAPKMDGQLHRVAVEGGKSGQLDGAYKGFLDGYPAGFIQNFKQGTKRNWKATGQKLDPQTLAEQRARIAENKAIRAQQLAAQHEALSKTLTSVFEQAPQAPETHPYLIKKGLSNRYDLRLDSRGNLLIPIEDKDGKIWSLQRISEQGEKGYEKGGKVEGGSFVLGGREQLKQAKAILISTGFATSASVHLATGLPVVAAFQDSNLKSVAQSLRQEFPKKNIYLFGDDDRHLPLKTPPLKNSGREQAEAAAQAIQGKAIFPQFIAAETGRQFTDFSDVHRSRGLETVKRQIAEQVKQHQQRVQQQQKQEKEQLKALEQRRVKSLGR